MLCKRQHKVYGMVYRDGCQKSLGRKMEEGRIEDLVEVEESDLLVTNSDLSRALWAALASYRLLSL